MAAHATARVTRAQRAAQLHGIYFIVNEGERALPLARAVLGAGIRIVQYRAKGGIVADSLRALRILTRECGALLLVNDDWQTALAFDCDGVHLGPDDAGFAQVARVRAALGERTIGLSCGCVEDVLLANDGNVDYVGVGSVYATASKADAGEPIGIGGLQRVAGAATVPVAAIGGITARTLLEVRRSGVAMAAVISAISDAPDPQRAAADLAGMWSLEERGA